MTADIRAAARRTIRLDHLQGVYRVGSFEWSWQEEYDDLMSRDATKMAALIDSIRAEGIREPILLGDDGRVWDGHHRICAAMHIGLDSVPVEWSSEWYARRDAA